MKKSVILSAILLSGLVYNNAKAQISIHVGFNIPTHRVYVPAPQPVEMVYNDDFDDSDDYYYLPEVEAYYSIPTHRYFYNDGARWVSAAYLPGAYRNYDWRTARRFEVRGRRPYMNHDIYRTKWGGNGNGGNWNRRNNNYAGRNNSGYGNSNVFNRRGNQPSGNNGYGQPNRNSERYRDSRGDNQPSQPNRNNNQGRGNWGGAQAQPGQNGGQQPDRNGRRRDRGNQAQPSNNGGGHNRGNNGGGGQLAQNQHPGRMGMARPRF